MDKSKSNPKVELPAENTINQQEIEVIMTEYNFLRNEDFKTKDRIQAIIIQSFIFIGVVSWFGWTNFNAEQSLLSVLIFLVFIPLICFTTLIILLSCNLRSIEICTHTIEVEKKVNKLLSDPNNLEPLSWMRVHYLENKGKGFEKILLRMDAGGSVILYVIIVALSVFVGYTLEKGPTLLFWLASSITIFTSIATIICAIIATSLQNKHIEKEKKSR